MVEGEGGTYTDIAFWLEMAGGATGDIRLLFSRFVKVADKTFHLGYRDVGPLYDLRMARGTSELLFPLHPFQVVLVVKDDILKNDCFLEIFLFVTLGATLVVDFCMGLRRSFARDKVRERQLPVSPFPLDVIDKSGFVVALDARYIFMF